VTARYQIAIIGAGVVGAAIARDLSRHRLDTVLIEAHPDPGEESSKGNSALMCSGVDVPAGTLERKLVERGYARYLAEAPTLGLPVGKVGAILLAWTSEEVAILERELVLGRQHGFTNIALLPSEEVYRRWPNFAPGIASGLHLPDEAIVDPFSTVYAYCLDAVENGVTFRRGWRVEGLERGAAGWTLRNGKEQITASFVINAGGIRADLVERLAGYQDFTIRPRRGQYLVLDKSARAIHDIIAMPTPLPGSRGILIAPTIFGNVLVGPTAENVEDRDDRCVTADGLAQLRQAMAKMVPKLADQPVNAIFAGMRPATEFSDYQIIPRYVDNWLTVAGIRSTGLSASLGIAEHVCALVMPRVFDARRKDCVAAIRVPDLSETSTRPWQDAARIAADSAYAEMLCHCERISVGEVRDALAAPLAPRTLSGLKRRTRAMFGRCQGFYCAARVQAMFDARGHALGQ
jgi:glycerol-3-phosphate dehydrogenase